MKRTQQVLNAISAREDEMFDFLAHLVGIQSGTFNKAGVDRVGAAVGRQMARLGFSCRRRAQDEFGDHLVFENRREAKGPQVLLVGHMDTVFPSDTDFTDFKRQGRTATGPGVIDMKGGLTAGIFALAALRDLGLLETLPVVFVFNSEEEVGSPTSGALIRSEAKKSAFAFVLEAGGLDGQVVTARKGNLSAVLTVTGRSGHAAFAGPEKASAVLELAHRIVAVEELNRPQRGVTVNVGRIEGGLGPNTVPGRAEALIDTRFESVEDGETLFTRLQEASRCALPGTSCRLTVRSRRPPMPECEGNRRLFSVLSETAAALGRPIGPELRPGVSDANLIADEGIPVLDGLGPIGARDHSPEEYMICESLAQRAALVACGIVDCWRRAPRDASG